MLENLATLFKAILFFVGIGLIFYYAVLWDNDRKWWKTHAHQDEKPLFIRTSATFLILFIIFCLSLLTPDLLVTNYSIELVFFFSIVLSFCTSFLWFHYLTWLDIFEKEKTIYLLLTFIISCGAVFLIYPLDNFIAATYAFSLNGEIWNDWWYSVLGIGLKEESIKIIPVILLLRFTKQINEPIDYLIYGAVSALGFAFIENIDYLYNSKLMALEGRVLYASLAHMIFTSIITYALAMKDKLANKFRPFIFPLALLIAAFSHGFYDFWLINPESSKFSFFTNIFLLLAIKWWFTMTSNLINKSPYFKHTTKYPIRYYKYWLLNYFIFVFILGVVFINIVSGQDQSRAFLYNSFGRGDFFMILFITINLNGIEIIKNYIHPFRLPKKITHLVLPALTYNSNLVGRTIKISHKKVVPTMVVDRELLRSMPIEGQLIRRMVCEEDLRWYLLQTKTTFIFRDTVVSYFYIKTKDEEADLSGTSFKNIEIRIPKHMVDKAQPTFEKSKTIHLTNLIAKETR